MTFSLGALVTHGWCGLSPGRRRLGSYCDIGYSKSIRGKFVLVLRLAWPSGYLRGVNLFNAKSILVYISLMSISSRPDDG